MEDTNAESGQRLFITEILPVDILAFKLKCSTSGLIYNKILILELCFHNYMKPLDHWIYNVNICTLVLSQASSDDTRTSHPRARAPGGRPLGEIGSKLQRVQRGLDLTHISISDTAVKTERQTESLLSTHDKLQKLRLCVFLFTRSITYDRSKVIS